MGRLRPNIVRKIAKSCLVLVFVLLVPGMGYSQEQAPPVKVDAVQAHSLSILGLDFSQAPSAQKPQNLPDLFEPSPRDPKKWQSRGEVFMMPLKEPGQNQNDDDKRYIWLHYPVTRGKFYIQYRSDRNQPQTERTYGPFEGDPFEKLQLEALMAARLKAEYSPDDLYRIKLMLRTQDAKMAARALRLMQPAIECDSPAVRTSILREVRQMLKDSAEAIKTHSLESEAAKLQENIQAAEANIEKLVAEIPDEQYQAPGESKVAMPNAIPKEAWGPDINGLRAAAAPRLESFAVGEKLPITLVVENVSDHDIKFSFSDLPQAARAEVRHPNQNALKTDTVLYTGISPLQRYVLKPGEQVALAHVSLKVTEKAGGDERPYGCTVVVDPDAAKLRDNVYQVRYSVPLANGEHWSRGADGIMRRVSPAKGEWSGMLTSNFVEVTATTPVKAKPEDKPSNEKPANEKPANEKSNTEPSGGQAKSEAKPPAGKPPAKAAEEKTAPITISGRTLESDSKPIAGAKVYLASCHPGYKRIAETKSDEEGRYEFTQVLLPVEGSKPASADPNEPMSGSFQVFGQADGHGFAWRPAKSFYTRHKPTHMVSGRDEPANFDASDKIALDLKFPPAAKLAGRIVDDRGEPVAQARLEIRFADAIPVGGYSDADQFNTMSGRDEFDALNERSTVPPEMKFRTSDADGRFEFTGLPTNCRFRIDVKASNFALRTMWAATQNGIKDDQGNPVPIDGMTLTLIRPAALSVQILYGDTNLPAPKVLVSGGGEGCSFVETTDAQGRVTLKIPVGHYKASVLAALDTPYLSLDSMLQTAIEFEVPREGATEPLVYHLPPAAVLELSVIDSLTGKGLEGLNFWKADPAKPLDRQEIFYRSWEAATHIVHAHYPKTDADGNVKIIFPPGQYRIGLGWPQRPNGYDVLEANGQEVDLQPGEPTKLTFHVGKTR